MLRSFKIAPSKVPKPMYGDRVKMPPLDSGWADRYHTYKTIPGFPETAAMARPVHVPSNAPHLETFDSALHSILQDPMLCMIIGLLTINAVLLLLILLKK